MPSDLASHWGIFIGILDVQIVHLWSTRSWFRKAKHEPHEHCSDARNYVKEITPCLNFPRCIFQIIFRILSANSMGLSGASCFQISFNTLFFQPLAEPRAASQNDTTRDLSRWFSTQPDETSGFVAAWDPKQHSIFAGEKTHGFRVGFEEFDTWDFKLWQGETLGKCMFAICIHATSATSARY